MDSSFSQHELRLRSGQAERGEFVADVGDLNIVGDDVAIEELQYFVSLSAFRIHQQRVSTLEDVEVGLNAALRVEQERIDAVAGRQGCQRITTLLGPDGFVNRFCVSVRGLNLRVRD